MVGPRFQRGIRFRDVTRGFATGYGRLAASPLADPLAMAPQSDDLPLHLAQKRLALLRRQSFDIDRPQLIDRILIRDRKQRNL
jgi:hypothetical protein